MIFTQEQVNEIIQRLSLRGIKDTEFESANDLTGDEKIPIIQEGKNKLLSMQYLLNNYWKDFDQTGVRSYTEDVYDRGSEKNQAVINEELSSRIAALEIGGMSVSATLTATGSNVYEFTGNNITFSMSGTIRFNNSSTLPSGATVTWTLIGNGVNVSGSTTTINATAQTINAGSYTYTVNATVTYKGKQFTATANTTFHIVKRSYVGFSVQDTASSNITLDPQTSIVATTLKNKDFTLTNNGQKYLWIITPDSINSVSTDWDMPIALMGTIDGLKYYKSVDIIDVGTLTFHIK